MSTCDSLRELSQPGPTPGGQSKECSRVYTPGTLGTKLLAVPLYTLRVTVTSQISTPLSFRRPVLSSRSSLLSNTPRPNRYPALRGEVQGRDSGPEESLMSRVFVGPRNGTFAGVGRGFI